MTYETYQRNVWEALGQWMGAGRDASKLYAIAQAHGVLVSDVEDMLADCLD